MNQMLPQNIGIRSLSLVTGGISGQNKSQASVVNFIKLLVTDLCDDIRKERWLKRGKDNLLFSSPVLKELNDGILSYFDPARTKLPSN